MAILAKASCFDSCPNIQAELFGGFLFLFSVDINAYGFSISNFRTIKSIYKLAAQPSILFCCLPSLLSSNQAAPTVMSGMVVGLLIIMSLPFFRKQWQLRFPL